MISRRQSVLLLGIFIFVSCIPNEKIVYLQGDNLPDQISYTPYILKPGDAISLQVISLTPEQYNLYNESNQRSNNLDPLLNGYVLNDSGYVRIPIVGKVYLKELTVEQAEDVLSERLSKVFKQASVNVKLLSYNFTVLGEVSSPGRFTIYEEDINLLEALAMAGDVTEFGDKSKIQITRFEDNKPRIAYINALEQEFLNSEFFVIRPGDMINVIPLKVKNTRKYQLANYGILLSTITVILLILNTTN